MTPQLPILPRLCMMLIDDNFVTFDPCGIPVSYPMNAAVGGFGLQTFSSRTIVDGSFVGTVAASGQRVNEFNFAPHAHTHLEALSHKSEDGPSVSECIQRREFVLAKLITVNAKRIESGDEVVLPSHLAALAGSTHKTSAVIVRVNADKYGGLMTNWTAVPNPPYFAEETGRMIKEELGANILATNLPSMDRRVDNGKGLAHRAFFGDAAERQLIGELFYLPPSLSDDVYVLSLIIPGGLETEDAVPFYGKLHRVFSVIKQPLISLEGPSGFRQDEPSDASA